LSAAGGSRETLLSLTTTGARKFLADHSAEVQEVLHDVPMLSFASNKPDERGYDSSFEIVRDWMLRYGVSNDGVVPEASAILPGSDFVRLTGMDHSEPIVDHGGRHFARVPFTQQLLSVFFQANAGL
jgi:hypothetical protein